MLYTGEEDGRTPILHRIKLRPIVTSGLDSIAPIFVFSSTIPADEVAASNDHTQKFESSACWMGTASAGKAIDICLNVLIWEVLV